MAQTKVTSWKSPQKGVNSKSAHTSATKVVSECNGAMLQAHIKLNGIHQHEEGGNFDPSYRFQESLR